MPGRGRSRDEKTVRADRGQFLVATNERSISDLRTDIRGDFAEDLKRFAK